MLEMAGVHLWGMLLLHVRLLNENIDRITSYYFVITVTDLAKVQMEKNNRPLYWLTYRGILIASFVMTVFCIGKLCQTAKLR